MLKKAIFFRDQGWPWVVGPTGHFYEDFVFLVLHFFHGTQTPRRRHPCVPKPYKCDSPGLNAALKSAPVKGQSALTPRKAELSQPAQHPRLETFSLIFSFAVSFASCFLTRGSETRCVKLPVHPTGGAKVFFVSPILAGFPKSSDESGSLPGCD